MSTTRTRHAGAIPLIDTSIRQLDAYRIAIGSSLALCNTVTRGVTRDRGSSVTNPQALATGWVHYRARYNPTPRSIFQNSVPHRYQIAIDTGSPRVQSHSAMYKMFDILMPFFTMSNIFYKSDFGHECTRETRLV